jgi:hypothetical protein
VAERKRLRNNRQFLASPRQVEPVFGVFKPAQEIQRRMVRITKRSREWRSKQNRRQKAPVLANKV